MVRTEPETIQSATTSTTRYTYDFLVAQRRRIQQDYLDLVVRHAQELAAAQQSLDEITIFLAEADKLGLAAAK